MWSLELFNSSMEYFSKPFHLFSNTSTRLMSSALPVSHAPWLNDFQFRKESELLKTNVNKIKAIIQASDNNVCTCINARIFKGVGQFVYLDNADSEESQCLCRFFYDVFLWRSDL